MGESAFVAIGVRGVKRYAESAGTMGWSSRPVRNGLLRAAGYRGRMLRLAHPDSPIPLVLVESEKPMCVAAMKQRCKNGRCRTQLETDPRIAKAALEDAPVANWLVRELGVLNGAVRK